MQTVQELLDTQYSGAGAVITAGDYRRQYQQHGKPFRWWKAYPVEGADGALGPNGEEPEHNGRIYVEQTLALNGQPLSSVRALPYRTTRTFQDREFGLFEAGATGVSVIPDEAEFARYDRIAFTDVTWIARGILKRGEDAIDELVRKPVMSVERVYKLPDGQSAVPVPFDEYRAEESGIEWLNANTVSTGDFYSIEYRFLPIFTWLGEEDQGVMQRGADGLYLPQRGVVTLERGYGED